MARSLTPANAVWRERLFNHASISEPSLLTAPAKASKQFSVGANPRTTTRFGISLNNASSAERTVEDGLTTYRAIETDTDLIWSSAELSAEAWYLLRSEKAPRAFTWQFSGAIKEAQLNDLGSRLTLVDIQGARFTVTAPGAVDATGRALAVTMSFDSKGNALTFSLPRSKQLTFPVLIDPLIETSGWVRRDVGQMPGRDGHICVFDEARRLTLVVGGNGDAPAVSEFATWNGVKWSQATTLPSGLANRRRHAATYDSMAQRVVLFGGLVAGVNTNDTWQFDGTRWAQVSTVHSPQPRFSHAMAYDSARQRVLMFGGEDSGGALFNDTWAFDGTDWQLVTSNATPPVRKGAALSYDSMRQKLVLFGGESDVELLSDTWEFDGSNWQAIQRLQVPSARSGHSMVFDASNRRTLLFAGRAAGTPLNDLWSWDGTSWREVSTDYQPIPRSASCLAYDGIRARAFVFSGLARDGTHLNDTLEFDGTDWVELSPAALPFSSYAGTMAYDEARHVSVYFGGFDSGTITQNTTAEWDGQRWVRKSPAHQPPARSNACSTYDARRNRIVLFGGTSTSRPADALDDTWEWNGVDWVESTPATRPPPSMGCRMYFDTLVERVVMFGGEGPGYQQIWEYDGTDWVQKPAPVHPLPNLHDVSDAYDSHRHRWVIIGTQLNDSSGIWEWDGSDWSHPATTFTPPRSRYQLMVYDPFRQKVIKFADIFDKVWEWDGTAWADATPPNTAALYRDVATGVFDTHRQRVLLFGGAGPSSLRTDTWELGWTAQCTTAADCRSGFCVDGYCCNSACGNGVADCQECNQPDNLGLCSPAARRTSCRTTSGACDVAETCDGVSLSCPVDRFAPPTLTCGTGSLCNGTNASCPATCADDTGCSTGFFCKNSMCTAKLAAATTCISGTQCVSGFCTDGVCCNTSCGDSVASDCEACNVAGHIGTCFAAPVTTVCRAAFNDCDIAETCSGTSTQCPTDKRQADGVVCPLSATKAGVCLRSTCVTPPDTEAPTITCPAALTLKPGQNGRAQADFKATATDNVDPSPLLAYSLDPGTEFNVGTTEVTATATDTSGNQAQCQFQVTVTNGCGCSSTSGEWLLALGLIALRRRR